MQLHQLKDDAEHETKSGVTSRRRTVGLTEALEHVWQEIRADATACIDNPELHVVVHGLEHDVHTSALRGEFDCICQQIPDRLLEPVSVAADRSGAGHRIERDLYVLGRRQGVNGIQCPLRDGSEIDRAEGQPNGSVENSRRIQEIVDHVRESSGVAPDRRDRAFRALRGQWL